MLEGLIAWVLNTYLGKYVSNLNTDQLSVALLKGAVELENLPLKKDALKEVLPFEVKAGFIGKITLQIPFYRPHIDPWVISVSKLYLIGSPEKEEEFVEARERLLDKENKKALLLALEEKWKKEREQIGESYWYSVTASVVTKIVENIELNIQDVHLRFEDGVSNPSQPFAFGICIKNVSMQNATDEPVEELMKKKRLDISDFSIYWDSQCSLWGDMLPGELQEAMDNSMERRDHDYIVEPVCTSALLKRNCSKEPLRSRNMPRLEFDIQLETIPLKLSQMQYRQIMDFLKELDRKERQLKFRKWRPKVTVTGNCQAWWLFALNAHLAEIREQKERYSWEFALRRARDAVLYTELYCNKLKELSLTEEEQEEVERIEDEQTFEELKILREIVYNQLQELAESIKEPLSDSLDSASEVALEGGRNSSSGMLRYLQSWFPGWGGWHSQSQEELETETIGGLLSDPAEEWRPEEVAGADDFFDPATDVSSINTFTKRDHVLVKLNLWLQGGSVTLLHAEKRSGQASERAFMQLQFSGVTILAETLPRRNSSLLKVQLGSLFLRDLATEGTIFPVLVFPNPLKEVGCASSVSLQTSSSDTSNQSSEDPVPVFEMLYEKNPARSNFERRLEVSTQPLNIIYNPQAIKKVADFFYKGRVHSSGFGCQSELELRVAEAARRQYNRLKMQTKAEIRQTIDRLLVGDFIEESKRWSICLDISAPQVIFPDDFKFSDPVLVVIDLGRMLLTNSQEEHRKKSPDGPSLELSDLSDEEYKTPLATPPNSPPPELNPTGEDKSSEEFPGVEISEEQLQAHLMSKKMYETYTLSFNDLQIMVGRVKDNWKYAQDIDVGPTHVVEKFNVHLQLERRLIYTSDPKYPGAVLSGNLPDLKIHINEDKIVALNNCFGRLSTPDPEGSQAGKEAPLSSLEQRGSLHNSVVNLTQSVILVEQHTKEVLVESQLLLAEFRVNCMQLAVESNGRYISVLKVFGTNAHFVKRPYDVEVSLTVHGLLLVDTMQTYGADFDLLMASHKNLSFDLPTGSLRDSKAQSPVNGLSETLLVGDTSLAEKCTQASSKRLSGTSSKRDESLIKLEYQFVTAECPSMNLDSSLQVLTVQMNNLDIILNPETIVELIGFLQKSFPKEKDEGSPQPLLTDAENTFGEQENFQSTHSQSIEVAVEIHWLNVLLLRTVTLVNREKFGRKIATASIGGTRVNVSMGSRLEVNGSLGCLHLMDLTQDNVKNQYVVSIGNTERYESLIRDVGYARPTFPQFEDASGLPDALCFTFLEQSAAECSLLLQMASLHYNHSAKFLKEIALSLDELEENFRGMLKSAASKVTTVLATKTAEYSEMVSLFDTTPRSRDPFNLEHDDGEEQAPLYPKTETIKLVLNVKIESPVVSIPRKPGSPELLVGHLGQISIQNFVTGEDNLRSDSLQVEIRDIKMYSLNCSHLAGKKDSPLEAPPELPSPSGYQEESQFTRHDFFESLHKGQAFHILNNATIQFILEKIPIEPNAELAFSPSDSVNISSLMRIEGKFVNPLQVILAKHVYEQVMQTMDNLVCNEDLTKPPSSFPSSTYSSLASPSACLRSLSADFPAGRKENGFFSHATHSDAKGPRPVQGASQSFTQIQAMFHIAWLQVQLSGDLTLGAQGLVSLTFQDFDVEFSKDHPHTLSIQTTLRSLLMEDLLVKNPDSPYRNLMVSHGAPKPSSLAHKEYLSQSCPLVSNVEYPDMPRSLPSHMEEAPNVFQFYQRPSCVSHPRHHEGGEEGCPLTPPPSPTARELAAPSGRSDFDDSLVHINVLLVDKKHPEFSSRYDRIHRSVDIDFNCLDILITLQTWVVILDFFSIGSTAENHGVRLTPSGEVQQAAKSEFNPSPDDEAQEESVNSKLDLKVHSLSMVLNKATNELAKANVSKLVTHMETREGDLTFRGSIGSLSLSDLTSHGELYRERFTTSGEEALIFHIHKYGRPDLFLQRECDVRVSLRMASVQYIHTQRFQAEVISFIQHFTQLQDVLGRQRAAVEGQTVRDQAQRAARILLDIEAGAPVLLIPESSRSSQLIVANLGKLKIKNRFLVAGTSATFSLKDKDPVLFSSPLGTPKHNVKKTPSGDESKKAPHFPEGLPITELSSGPILGGQKSEHAPETPSSPLSSAENPGKRRSCYSQEGLLPPLSLPLLDEFWTVLSGEVYICLSFLINMVNVSLELTGPQPKQGSLARFDFKKSKLLFESCSNQTRTINLVSHSMMAFDTRYGGQAASAETPNVFNCIFQPSKSNHSQGAIQIELHYRSTKDSSSFTVVLNNLRVFLIFDWLVLVHDFLQTPSDPRKPAHPSPASQRSLGGETAVVPKTIKCGIVTKRSSLQISTEKQLEVKVNVTDTEFVVVEDTTCSDTNAVILKGTTVLTYKPKVVDHPFSGSLSGIEVFSCRLGNEQETALSILDPALIQVELVGNSSYPNGSGLLDAFNGGDFPPLLEIQLQTLDIRLSYNDVQLFLAIAKSISKQTSGVLPSPPATDSPAPSGPSEISGTSAERMEGAKRLLDPVLEVQLARLQELGFSLDDCRKALLDCQGQLKKAASWLFKNAEPLKRSGFESCGTDGQSSRALRLVSGVEVKAESICICFIDDCMDCDVPLAELTFSRLNFLQHLRASPEGYAHFTLSGDYYNRELSGWEPFIEPWPCSVFWQRQPASRLHPSRLKLEVKAKHRLDVNITSRLIEQYASTKQSWMADYCSQEKEVTDVESEDWVGSSVDPPSFRQGLPLAYLRTRSTASLTNLEHQMYARAEMKAPKRRQPFVPFALRNHTGCTLWFATMTTTPTRAALLHSGSPPVLPEEKETFLDEAHKVSEWREV
ncbi:PREDICTED: vacuolar protein sorting-associated protein 13D, partial [Thamnophis sirtalis]|uniref:Vacuolar protein sorting-associated protein 13D n=1 Tax=Thamnophis sirtalis TaxID=35019 RepID=A0A6I9YPT5_9SAUR